MIHIPPMDYLPGHLLDRAFRRLSRRTLHERLAAVRALSHVRGLRYLTDAGRPRVIELSLKPWVLTSAQLLTFHRSMMVLAGALARLPALHAADAGVREVIRFDPARAAWLTLAQHPASKPWAVMGRLDCTASYGHATWRRDFRMLEPNSVGVGGVYYAPTACGIVKDAAGDLLTQALPGRVITPTPDPRQLLVDELAAVAARRRRPLRGVALIENTEFTTGTDEFSRLAEDLRLRGVPAVVADPRELRMTRRGLTAKGLPVDLLYRDCELAEFTAMEARGAKLTAMRQAVREGRLVSGLTWEFDQKSAWEIFTDARHARHFSAAERRFFREHLLWTRLVRQARVTDPSGQLVDLPAYIRRHQARLVLKPNNLFGGEGVTIGPAASRRDWERQLATALRGRQKYVVQELATIRRETLPLLVNDAPKLIERSTVSGFFFTSGGIGLIGRFSPRTVVNVSQGGGLIAAFWVH